MRFSMHQGYQENKLFFWKKILGVGYPKGETNKTDIRHWHFGRPMQKHIQQVSVFSEIDAKTYTLGVGIFQTTDVVSNKYVSLLVLRCRLLPDT